MPPKKDEKKGAAAPKTIPKSSTQQHLPFKDKQAPK